MQGPKILIVDDEEELVTTMVERLEWRGMAAEGVTDGRAALQRLAEGGFDVVLVDLKMPGMSGLEVVDALRQQHPDVTILLTTGHGNGTDELVELPAGVREIMLKPFDIDLLIGRIVKLRQSRRSQP